MPYGIPDIIPLTDRSKRIVNSICPYILGQHKLMLAAMADKYTLPELAELLGRSMAEIRKMKREAIRAAQDTPGARHILKLWCG